MFGIGPGEFVIICVVLIIAVGPERLPQFMKTVGGTLRTLRQASRDIRTSVGIDEMMRPDPPPRPKPRTPPAQTLSRTPAAPSAGADEADSLLTTVAVPAALAPAAPAPAAPAPAAPAPAAAVPGTTAPNQLLSPAETITSSDVTALFKAAHRPPPAPAPAPAAPSPFAAAPAASSPAAPAPESGEPPSPAPGAPPAPTGEG